ncbi:MAG: phosphatidylglycerophosphatase A [Paracoccaceae bacterium]
MKIAALLATAGGIGRIPFAPGTWGTLPALPIAWAAHWAGGINALVFVTAITFALGWWATGVYLDGREEDPKEVVIDEVAGMLLTLWPLSWGLSMSQVEPHVFPWPGWVGGFLLFRFFDIVKPPPVNWADRPGPLGVMLDDMVAGAMAGALMLLAAGIAHGWF